MPLKKSKAFFMHLVTGNKSLYLFSSLDFYPFLQIAISKCRSSFTFSNVSKKIQIKKKPMQTNEKNYLKSIQFQIMYTNQS